jgi:hypothetical protein
MSNETSKEPIAEPTEEQMRERGYITTYRALIGWKAVHVWWNPELGGFWEPWNTGVGAYDDPADAIVEAKGWAENEGLPYVACGEAMS